jgi:hypothetical protein
LHAFASCFISDPSRTVKKDYETSIINLDGDMEDGSHDQVCEPILDNANYTAGHIVRLFVAERWTDLEGLFTVLAYAPDVLRLINH